MQKREADIEEPIYHYPAILSGDYYMFDYPLDAPDSSNRLISEKHNSSQSRDSMHFFDVFDWKIYDAGIFGQSPLANETNKKWNNTTWDEELIDNQTLQQSWNANDNETSGEKIPLRIDLSSFLTFSELKQNSDKIRRTLVNPTIRQNSISHSSLFLPSKKKTGCHEFSFSHLFGSSCSHIAHH